MKLLKNWLYNLKIRSKLLIILIITIVNFVIFFALSNFFLNTTSSFTSMIDAERMHTQYFETGLGSFLLYINTNDSSYYSQAINNIKKANRLASIMVNIDSIVANTNKSEFRDIFWDYYKEPLHFDKNAVNLFADRTRLFTKLKFSILIETYAIAAEGYVTGERVVSLIEEYKLSRSPEIFEKIKQESNTIREFYISFSDKIYEATKFGMNLLFIISLSILALLIIVTLFSINKLSKYLHKQLAALVDDSIKIAKGDLNIEIHKPSKDEIGKLFDAFNTIVLNMKKLVSYASNISNGEFDSQIEPRSKNDELSHALNSMSVSLNANKIKNEVEAWESSGLNNLNKEISGDLSLNLFTNKTLNFLLKYVDGISGNFYSVSNNKLVLQKSIAMDPNKSPDTISLGAGIIGKAAENNKIVHLKNLQDNNYNTFTSTVDIKLNELIIIPLHFNNITLGVIEITSITGFSDKVLHFINSVSDILSIGLHVTISRQQLKELLETTQQQAEELEVQQEELRTSNAELEEQTQQLRENEMKLQAQQEELRITNEELVERTHDLEIQRNEVVKNSTELEKAKQIVEQKAREVEIASKYKSVFLANMSHELRTPLNSLLILSKDLSDNKKKNLSIDQIESATIINNSGKELLELINDILDLSKIEAGKMMVNSEYITLDDLKLDMINMFKHVADNKNLDLSTGIDNKQDVNLFNDRQKIDQILKNLVSNALKFTTKGSVSINFRISSNNPDILCIDVIDTGIGIPENKQLEIFEAFQQVDGSISRNFGGTGLGLSISRELAKLLNGSISLSSEVNQGSTFTLCIPVNYSVEEKNELVSSLPENLPEQPKPKRELKEEDKQETNNNDDEIIFIKDDRKSINKNDKIILIIEDDLVLAENLKGKCYDAGFKCIVAGTGENGLFLTEKYHPDAIILDIMLPGIDGYKVLEILKENPETRHIPVQMMSSLDPNLSSVQKWAIGYLTKPLTQESIDSAIGKISSHINKNVKDLLIIEDDEANSIMISKLLGGKDVDLTLTGSGKEALQLLIENTYDCVVLDLGLHDMSGIELVREINRKFRNNLPPIIVYTARDLTKEETKELQRYTKSIIIKGVKSDGRLLDETALFLHRVVDDMSESKKKIINKLHNKEAVFENKTVLVVDDDMRNVFALTKIMEDHHLNVIEAENGLVALSILSDSKNQIDIVLMDVMMPEMDGLTAIKEIRKDNKHRDLPIIVLTAKAMKEDRSKAIESGANDYLSKPVDIEKLLSLMRVWLYNRN